MVDRFVIAAIVDRLIYEHESSFSHDDARLLLESVPHRPSPWIQLGVAGKMSGGSSRGFAAGIGDVQISSDKERQFQYSTGADAYTRAGQWKLMWIGRRAHQYVEIEQVMADATDEGRGALICYEADGTPMRMDIRFNRSFRLFWSPVVIMFPGWKPWKCPDINIVQAQGHLGIQAPELLCPPHHATSRRFSGDDDVRAHSIKQPKALND